MVHGHTNVKKKSRILDYSMMRYVSIVLGLVNNSKILKSTYTPKTLKLYRNLSTNKYLKIAN